ncbi:unnamed protein product, partial [Symbiodinium sp. KB8]
MREYAQKRFHSMLTDMDWRGFLIELPKTKKEFISSPRIDNQLSTWGAIQGLCDYAEKEAIAEAKDICVAVSFDHEE